MLTLDSPKVNIIWNNKFANSKGKMASIAVNVDQSAAANANIKALEGLLDEFFRDVSNARKAEIERMLAEFGEQVIFYN